MEQTVIKVSDLAYLIAFVISLYSLYKIIAEIRKPRKDTEEKILNNERIICRNSEKIQELEELNILQCRVLFRLLDHMITGNGLEKLKETKVELRNYLTNKGVK